MSREETFILATIVCLKEIYEMEQVIFWCESSICIVGRVQSKARKETKQKHLRS